MQRLICWRRSISLGVVRSLISGDRNLLTWIVLCIIRKWLLRRVKSISWSKTLRIYGTSTIWEIRRWFLLFSLPTILSLMMMAILSICIGCRCTTMNRACSVTSITDVHINGSGQVKKRCSVYSTVKMTLVSIRVSVGHFFPTTRKQFLCGRSWKMAEACILPPILPKDKWKGKKSLH